MNSEDRKGVPMTAPAHYPRSVLLLKLLEMAGATLTCLAGMGAIAALGALAVTILIIAVTGSAPADPWALATTGGFFALLCWAGWRLETLCKAEALRREALSREHKKSEKA